MRVGANAEPKASTLVSPEDSLHVVGAAEPFVSRAGRKLDAALSTFDITVAGRRAIDIGASTGGFTDCLLQRQAHHVVAVDVGYGQMHWRVRQDNRVEVIERTNIRNADPTTLGAPFDVVVGDVSFISLAMLAPQIRALGSNGTDWVLLIKPQFEVGKDLVGKGGIVRDELARQSAIRSVADAFSASGLGLRDVIVSPITGTTGNVEYLAWFRTGQASASIEDLIVRTLGEPS